MPHIKSDPKAQMMAMLDKAENQVKNFRSIAAEMYKFAPQKLNQSQKNKVKSIAEQSCDLLVKGFPDSRKYIKKHYSQEEWERDCKLVEDILTIGTAKITAHAQEVLNEINGEFGATLEDSLDTTVVPTLRLCVGMIKQACAMMHYCETCLSEAFHDDWDMIVEIEDIIPEKAMERYRKALEMLDKDMRKAYFQKKKSLEKTYGKSIHRSERPEMDYYINEKGERVK